MQAKFKVTTHVNPYTGTEYTVTTQRANGGCCFITVQYKGDESGLRIRAIRWADSSVFTLTRFVPGYDFGCPIQQPGIKTIKSAIEHSMYWL